MDWFNKNMYFETSAVNFVLRDLAVIDAIATRSLQTSKGNKWYISPVALWELMLIEDEAKREEMLELSQHTFFKKLLKSPSEIIFDFLEEKMGDAQSLSIHSDSELAKTWTAICENLLTRLEFDEKELKKTSAKFKSYSKKVDQIINSIFFDFELQDETRGMNIIVNSIFNTTYKNDLMDPRQAKIMKISLLFILMILCIGVDITPDIVQGYWEKKGIKGGYNRLEYILSTHPKILNEGPIVFLSFMAFTQMNVKKSRGLFHDALHCLYIPFVDAFFTNDSDFLEMKNAMTNPSISKIYHMDQINYLKKKTWVDYEPFL